MAKEDRYAHLNAEAGDLESSPTGEHQDRDETDEGLYVTITDGDQEVVVELADDSLTVDDVRRSLERRDRSASPLPASVRLALTASRQTVRASTAMQRYVAGAPIRAAVTITPWTQR